MGDVVVVGIPPPPRVRINVDAQLRQPSQVNLCDGRVLIHAWLNPVVARHVVDGSTTIRVDRLILPQRFTQPFEADTHGNDEITCCDGAAIDRTGGNNIEVVRHWFNHWKPEIVEECDDDGKCMQGTVKFSWSSALLPLRLDADTGLPFSDPLAGELGVHRTIYELLVPWKVCPDPRWRDKVGPYAKLQLGTIGSPTGSIFKGYGDDSSRGREIYEQALTVAVWNRDERVPEDESPWRDDD